jgi:DnaK suppressor protein
MTPEDRAHLKKKIKDLIVKYNADIIETEKMTQPIGPENAIGRVSRMDAINNKSVMEASLRSKVSKRNKLKMALTQVDKEGFGLCTRCKRIINPARLMFMPESTKCIHCADKV